MAVVFPDPAGPIPTASSRSSVEKAVTSCRWPSSRTREWRDSNTAIRSATASELAA
jgi:hypothetical protein